MVAVVRLAYDRSLMRVAWCSDPAEFPTIQARLVERLRRRGLAVEVIGDHAALAAHAAHGFDVGVLRTRDADRDPECCAVAAALERGGVPFLNSVAARDAACDKAVACALFDRAGLPQPAWFDAGDGGGRTLEGPVVLKPRRGGRGEGVRVLESVGDALARASGRGPSMVQRYVPRALTWRVIATPDRVLHTYAKVAAADGIGSLAQGATARTVPAPRPV